MGVNETERILRLGENGGVEPTPHHTREVIVTYYPDQRDVIISHHREEGCDQPRKGERGKKQVTISLPPVDRTKGPVARLYFPFFYLCRRYAGYGIYIHNPAHIKLWVSFFNGTLKHLSEYDAIFSAIKDDTFGKTQAALMRLQYPYELEESYKEVYKAYLRRYARQYLPAFIEQANMDLVIGMIEFGLIPAKSIQSYIDLASKFELPEMVAILLDYQNKHLGKSRRSSLKLKKVKTADTWLNFKNPDGTLSIAKYRGKDTDVVIPAFIDGKPVKRIGWQKFRSVFYANKDIQQVHIEPGIEEIGNRAFFECRQLRDVEIPDSVTRIGYGAFIHCYSLADIDIPDSVISIAGNALWGSGLYNSINTTLILFGSICLHYSGHSQRPMILPDGIRIIAERAFQSTICGKSITLPDSLKIINTYAFSYCSNLETIRFPHHMLSIDPYAFERCYSLTSVVLPDGLTEVSTGVFSMCDHLTSVAIPEGVLRIGAKAFEGCTRLTDVSIPKSVTVIDKTAFERTPFANSMPDEIKALIQQ